MSRTKNLRVAIGAAILLALPASALFAQHQFSKPSPTAVGDIAPGIDFPQVVHNVADLDRSIKWYTAIHFKLTQPPTPWTVDEALNKVGNTPGAESRTAILKVATPDPGIPLTLVLRQYRGVARQDWSKPQPADANAYRGDLQDAKAFLTELGLFSLSAAYPGPRFAVMEDLDGLVFQARALPNGFEVNDFSASPKRTPQAVQLQDINANFATFQVKNIEAVYAQAKENGATTVTDGGIVNYNNGRAVLLREPYLHSFVMLWQPTK